MFAVSPMLTPPSRIRETVSIPPNTRSTRSSAAAGVRVSVRRYCQSTPYDQRRLVSFASR